MNLFRMAAYVLKDWPVMPGAVLLGGNRTFDSNPRHWDSSSGNRDGAYRRCVTSTARAYTQSLCAPFNRRAGAPVSRLIRPSTETPQARRRSKIDWTSAAKDALLWVPAGGHGHPVKHSGLASRCAGLWVVRASIPARRTNGAQTMSTLSIKSRNTKSAAPKKGSAQSKTASRRKVTSPAANAKKPTRSVESKTERVAAAKTLRKADEPRAERVTKQERVLTLLSQSEGASIEEMMQATDWQQHSVRGFLAGTVKRKLGFSLTSLKPNGGVRRYRIETRRGR